MTTQTVVRSLYRSLLREANKLPYDYVRFFFRIKLRDDITSAVRTRGDTIELSSAKAKRIKTELRRLKAANAGDQAAFTRALDLAYGRTGKLKRELMEPFLSTTTAEKPPPIILGVEKSRPPVYSQELTALLTSKHSRTTKPLKPCLLKTPPALPSRADPMSEDARLLGPFSKRREVNIRWRFFTKESRKVYPPVQVSVLRVNSSEGAVGETESSRREDIQDLGLLAGGFQGAGLLEMLEGMAGGVNSPPMTRRERKAMANKSCDGPHEDFGDDPSVDMPAIALPSRFLRRRHQDVLGKLPLLMYRQIEYKTNGQTRSRGKYEVTLPTRAMSPALHYTNARLAEVDETNLAWISRAQEIDKRQKTAKGL